MLDPLLKEAHGLYGREKLSILTTVTAPGDRDLIQVVVKVVTPYGEFDEPVWVYLKDTDDEGAVLSKVKEEAREVALRLAGFGGEGVKGEIGTPVSASPTVRPTVTAPLPMKGAPPTAGECRSCGDLIRGYRASGKFIPAPEVARLSAERYGVPMCSGCMHSKHMGKKQ